MSVLRARLPRNRRPPAVPARGARPAAGTPPGAVAVAIAIAIALAACGGGGAGGGAAPETPPPAPVAAPAAPPADLRFEALLAKYTTVRLEADLSHLSLEQRLAVKRLIAAADTMNDAFWRQAYGDRAALLGALEDPGARRFAEINYGPWDRLDGNAPFLPGVGPKPPGAAFYPPDLDRAAFEAAAAAAADGGAALRSLYTMVRRDPAGALVAVPYSVFFRETLEETARELRTAAELVGHPGFADYLRLRAAALLTDDYRASDLAWLDVEGSPLDLVIGPIETYEDQLFGQKAAFEAYVLLVDRDWSARLARYAAFLPSLQAALPVPRAYRRERPGADSDLVAYDVLYYAGDCNSGSKSIAVNLPNDEQVQLEKGTRRMQLKNAMRAKFDRILVPMAELLVAEDQRAHVTFDAFFGNTMFHEVAHGLGIKKVIRGPARGTNVRATLREHASTLEEGKADVLGLFMVDQLLDRGEDTGASRMDHYVTFVASIFRSIRFGAASAHGRANLIRLRFLLEQGAVVRDEATGTYRVVESRMRDAVAALSGRILRLQGDGDLEAVAAFVAAGAVESELLRADLARVAAAGIPVDVVFEQGTAVLGLD